MNIANRARRLLIHLGKTIPFVLCFILFIAYAETLFALTTSDFLAYNGSVIPNTPLSFKIASLFEYDLYIVVITLVISFAIEACIWNRLAILYLSIHLLAKHYIDFAIDIETIYVIAFANMVVSFFFVCKGFMITIRKKVK